MPGQHRCSRSGRTGACLLNSGRRRELLIRLCVCQRALAAEPETKGLNLLARLSARLSIYLKAFQKYLQWYLRARRFCSLSVRRPAGQRAALQAVICARHRLSRAHMSKKVPSRRTRHRYFLSHLFGTHCAHQVVWPTSGGQK